jgi:SUZ domain
VYFQPKNNQKTLKQREAEYAEARLRILGSQQPQPEAPKQSVVSNGQKNINNGPKNNANNGGRAPARNSLPRMPRGPDGTKGFQQAR